MDGAVLVTGGAGYIGSHAVLALSEQGLEVVVVDNLSTGSRALVPDDVAFIEGDVADGALIARAIKRHRVTAVMHFAGSIVVPESVSDPLKYYGNNTAASRNLIAACVAGGVHRFIFSSTAAVYGIPHALPATEATPLAPINPYGRSKLMTEWMLQDVAAAGALRFVILRYFNVAGADPAGRSGQATPRATHLIKVACEAALGARREVTVFGEDYDTPDGTGVRDYIHVSDLAAAHVDALRYLASGGASLIANCGYGWGFSVREVLAAVEREAGAALVVRAAPRRAGDPPSLVADATRIGAVLGWRPRYRDLGVIVKTALDWERKLQAHRKPAYSDS